jgi:hypothetical protein
MCLFLTLYIFCRLLFQYFFQKNLTQNAASRRDKHLRDFRYWLSWKARISDELFHYWAPQMDLKGQEVPPFGFQECSLPGFHSISLSDLMKEYGNGQKSHSPRTFFPTCMIEVW